MYSHYPLNPNEKSSDTKGTTFSIRQFCFRIERVMTVYENYNVIGFKSCIQKFTVWCYRRNLDGLGFILRQGFGRTGPVWEIEAILPKTGMIPPRPSLLYWAGFRLGFAWQSRLSSCDTPFLRNCHINHYTYCYHIIEFPFPSTFPLRFIFETYSSLIYYAHRLELLE